ncbi:MAG: ribonuclease PH [Candidatus Latescibacteria bacterium]|nr:ribonuclease PH [Candidatus Latescibacterota bacterium]
MSSRKDGRSPFEIRDITLTRNYLPHAEGSCFVKLGDTHVIIAASVQNSVPPWLQGQGTGWITAEYGMLPRSTHTRNRRPTSAMQQNGRTMEIQRVIGRALRAVTDFKKLGERTITIDCDVVNADGGTRVASIIGAAIALHDACTWMLEKNMIERQLMSELVAAISVGVVNGEVAVDLSYTEDSSADVDMNIVMTESCDLVEIQGTAEGSTFDRAQLDAMIDAAECSIKTIIDIQKQALGLS